MAHQQEEGAVVAPWMLMQDLKNAVGSDNKASPQNVFIKYYWTVNSRTKSSTGCLLLPIIILSCRFCEGVDFLTRVDTHVLSDKRWV